MRFEPEPTLASLKRDKPIGGASKLVRGVPVYMDGAFVGYLTYRGKWFIASFRLQDEQKSSEIRG